MKQRYPDRLLYWIFLLLSLAVVQCAYAGDDVADINTSQINQFIKIRFGKSIEIEMMNTPLQDALAAITQKSNIHFEVPDNLRKDKITFRSSSMDWPEALKRMLKQYNVAFGWEKNELKTVFIFERGTGKVVQLIPTPANELRSDSADSNQHDIDAQQDGRIIPLLPSVPLEEEKIIEIKPGAQQKGKREEKPEIENIEDFTKGLFPELSPESSGTDSDYAAPSPVPDEPARMKEK